MTTLTYIFHDCFLYLTTPDNGRPIAVIFDYWQSPGIDILSMIPDDADIYVLVSHFHKDHYNPDIFKWSASRSDIRYVISRDTARHARHILRPDSLYKGIKPAPDSVAVLSKGESFDDDRLSVHAFGSTDIGNSYVITIHNGDTILHAGDLNCWTWRDESTEAEIRSAVNAFNSELTPIARRFPTLDFAMFPVDSRIGSLYWQGAHTLLSSINVRHFLPMHFELADNPDQLSQRHNDALRFADYAAGNGEFIGLSKTGDNITIL